LNKFQPGFFKFHQDESTDIFLKFQKLLKLNWQPLAATFQIEQRISPGTVLLRMIQSFFKMRRIVIVACALCLVAGGLKAQEIIEEPLVAELMDRFVEYNRANTEVRGWRIQVLSTTDRRMMESTQSTFKRKFPEYKLIFEHQNPFYNLKTGAFLTQQDARPMLRKLQKDFAGSFVVTDRFEVSEVLDYQ
jgi:hypothetical protein